METNRRAFVQQLGAGAAGLTLAAAAGSALAQAPAGGRKMVIRADDVGHSKVCNIGTFEAIDGGMVTSVDIMLDSPGTEDALMRLRNYPWLSLGWHMHMWGAPVLPASRVPSLIEKGGEFDGRFRMDLARAPEVNQEEAVAELRAQLERSMKILGKIPDTGAGGNATTPWGRAVKQVSDEFGIAYNYASSPPAPAAFIKKIVDAQKAGEEWAAFWPTTPGTGSKADDRWASRKIINPAGTTAYVDLLTDSISSVEKNYDPVLFYTQDRAGILKGPADAVYIQAWHPGYVDYYVYRLGERVARPRAQQFVVGRTQDVAALTSNRLRDWIRANRIELVNQRDALYGTREFQNHLRSVGSNLAIG